MNEPYAVNDETELRRWRQDGVAPAGSCPYCASRISMVERDGWFRARCSHRGCGATGPRMRSISRAADLFCCPPTRTAAGMSTTPHPVASCAEHAIAAPRELPPLSPEAQELVDGRVAANRPPSGKRTAIAAPRTDLRANYLHSIADTVAALHAVDHAYLRNHCVAAAKQIRAIADAAPRPATVGELLATAPVARPISEWHEDHGDALWWRFPINEPPYSGSPLDIDWPGYHTHWTPIVCPEVP